MFRELNNKEAHFAEVLTSALTGLRPSPTSRVLVVR